MSKPSTEMSFEARNLSWLLNGFVRKVPGMTEAVVLSLVGGVIGIGGGFGLAFLGRWTLGLYTSVPTWAGMHANGSTLSPAGVEVPCALM